MMRKVLLLGAALLVSAGIMAQSTSNHKMIGASNKYEKVKKNERIGSEAGSKVISPAASMLQKSTTATQSITKTYIGTSANCFSVLLSEETGLTAHEGLNLIMMTHRQDGTTLPSYTIQCSYSTDGGFSFDDSTATVYDGTDALRGRYPGGVIFNPSGNNVPTNAFAVVTGPMSNSGGFIGGFFASERLDGTLNNSQTTLYTTDTVGGIGDLNQFPRMHQQNCGSKFFTYGDANTDDGTYYTGFTTVLNVGTWDGGTNSVDWVRVSHTPNFLTDGLGNPDGYAYPGLVFEPTGTTGYLIYIGRDGAAADQLTYQPLVYKSVDGGMTWNKDAAFDWTTSTTLSTIATDLSPVGRPMFGSIRDITMDENGYPHFVSYIHGAFSDHVDSLGYYAVYTGMQGIVCDVFMTSTGWDAVVVDTVFATDPDDDNTLIDPGTANAVPWDERFQISRSEDGSKIFYAWMDTDPMLSEVNLYPDVYVKMYDVATATMGPRINLTQGTDYDANNYWMYLSNVCFDMGSYYQVHINTSTLETNSNNPVDHEYINGVYLDENGNLVTSVSDLPLEALVNMYPNPTSSDLNLAFNDNASGKFNVVVYNTLGSVVMSENFDVTGAVVRTLSLNELPTGVYMVEVSGNNGVFTKKIMKN